MNTVIQNKYMSLVIKVRIHKTVVRPFMICAAGTRSKTKMQKNAHHRTLRTIHGKSLRNSCTQEMEKNNGEATLRECRVSDWQNQLKRKTQKKEGHREDHLGDGNCVLYQRYHRKNKKNRI